MQERALFNQIQYSDACNFNNIYLILVPKTADNKAATFLLPSQKELIRTSIQELKCMTSEISYVDPIYKAVAIGISTNNSAFKVEEERQSKIFIKKRTSTKRDDKSIVNDVVAIFKNYFNKSNVLLGQSIDVKLLSQQILSVDGVDTFYTGRVDDTILFEGLSLFIWNPDYPTADKMQVATNTSLKLFEYPYLFDVDNLENKISIYSNTEIKTAFSGY